MTADHIRLPFAFAPLMAVNALCAQSVCDSLQIIAINHAPFTDTAMQVTVLNQSTELFGYPRFSLVNEQGDTLAQESVNFFGIGWSEQDHRLDRLPGTAPPDNPFTGTLVLDYFTGNGGQQCTFSMLDVPLCPPSCETMQVFLYAQFGTLVTSSFPWTMSDSLGVTVAQGTLSIHADSLQQDLDTFCLTTGSYVLHITQPNPSGVEFVFGVTQQSFLVNGPSGLLQVGGSADLAFDYYPACIDPDMSVEEESANPPVISYNGQLLTISDPQQRPLGEVYLLDITGRCVRRSSTQAFTTTLDLSDVARGILVIQLPSHASAAARVLVH